jgi:hypothetical protein
MDLSAPLPELHGGPVEVRFVAAPRDRRGPVHGGAFVRERRIVLDRDLRANRPELARIFVHEVFHFGWVRLGNGARRSWEGILRAELKARARGELGWSSEWRKAALGIGDVRNRTRRWREYCCESFCDTAAWLFSGTANHDEFTLGARSRRRRGAWFAAHGLTRRLSI